MTTGLPDSRSLKRIFDSATVIRLMAYLEKIYVSDSRLFTLLSILVVSASLLRPLIPWDTLAYHLPFGVKLAHLEKAGDFSLSSKYYKEYLEYRFMGFPLLPYYILGYMFLLFKSLRVLPLISSVPLILLAYSVKNLFGLSRSQFLCTCLAVPMIAIHSHCAYIDMICGVLVAFLAFLTIKLLEFQLSIKERYYLATFFILISFLSGQTKFFAVPFVYTLALIGVWASITRCEDRKQGLFLASFFVVAVCAASVKLLTNWAQYDNPFYPIATLVFKGPESAWFTDPGYLKFLGPLARPIYFLTSITELDLLIRGIRLLYTVGSSGVNDAVLTAGFGFLCIISFFIWEVFYCKKSSQRDARITNTSKVLLVMLLVNSVLPQAHVLRYWMYIPFIAVLLVIFQVNLFDLRTKRIFFVWVAVLFLLNTLLTTPGDRIIDTRFHSTPQYPVEEIQKANPAYVCTGDQIYLPFLFSTVVNDGEWKTNTPECNENNDACKCFVDFNGREFTFNCVHCNQ